jgi:hypothetical protein
MDSSYPVHISIEVVILGSPYRKKNSRFAKHPSNAYLHAPNVLVAIEHSYQFYATSALNRLGCLGGKTYSSWNEGPDNVHFKQTRHAPYERGHEAQNLETMETNLVPFLIKRIQTNDSQYESRKQQRISNYGHYMPKTEGSPGRQTKYFVDLSLI